MAKSMLLEELGDRNTYKLGSVERLPPHSSTMVEIPPSFELAITKART